MSVKLDVLIDDQAARVEAKQRGLVVAGLLGVLTAAAILRLIDLRATLEHLIQKTNFRLTPELAQRAIERADLVRAGEGD